MNQSLTFYEGAIWVLWNNPDVWLSSAEIWNNLKDAGLVKTKGDTPWQTMNQSIRSNLKYFNEKTSGAGPYSLSDDGKRYYESSVRFKVEEFNKDDNTSTEIVATNEMIN